jgi:hypothetical protein
MPIAPAPPFQYALRGAAVADDPITAQNHEQRDRDLEDFLSRLASFVSYTPGGSVATAYGARIRRSIDGSVATGFTALTPVAHTTVMEEVNLGTTFLNAGDIVIPAGLAGRYVINAFVNWEATTCTNCILGIIVNGTLIARDAPANGAVAFLQQHISCVATLAVGDRVRSGVAHASGANRTIRAIAAAGGVDAVVPVLEAWRIGA